MMYARKTKLILLLSLFLIFIAVNPLMVQGTTNDDFVFTSTLCEISGAHVNEIVNTRNWKETSQYIFERYTINHNTDITLTQLKTDSLKFNTEYKFNDIIIAFRLAEAFGSAPETILELKPDTMDWIHYGGLLQLYSLFRKVFWRMDENPGILSYSKEELLAKEVIDDASTESILCNSGFSAEELLGIITLANLKDITKERLLMELGHANPTDKEPLANALHEINMATGMM